MRVLSPAASPTFDSVSFAWECVVHNFHPSFQDNRAEQHYYNVSDKRSEVERGPRELSCKRAQETKELAIRSKRASEKVGRKGP